MCNDDNTAALRVLTFAKAGTCNALPATSEHEVGAPKGRAACR